MGILQQIFGRGPAQQETPISPFVLQAGTTLAEKYVVRALLGRGGMGEVYLVEELSTGEMRAAKLMRASADASVEDLLAFRREAMALLNLGTHPFILRLFDVNDRGRDTVLIVEYVPPEAGCTSLHDYIVRTTDYTDRVLGMWAVQFCVGMEYALECGLQAHRDIKPANLLVGAAPFLKISDFGLALAASGHVAPVGRRSNAAAALQLLQSAEGRVTCGTPGYIAPEIWGGTKASAQSDIFSFGVTLWQLAARTLQMPFDVRFAGDVNAYQAQLLREAASRRVRRIDNPYFDVIRRCLEPDPSRRYPDFPSLREDLKTAAKRHGLGAMDFIVKPGFRGTLEDFIARGRAYLVLGRRARALKIINRAIEHDARSVPALVARGDIYLGVDDTERAMRDFAAAREVAPEADAPVVGMAKALLLLGRIDSAERLLAEILARHPGNLEARLQAASAMSRRGRNDDALAIIDQVLHEVPDHALAHEYRARILWSRNEIDRANRALHRAIAADPMSLSAGLLLASIARDRDRGDLKDASAAYDRVLALYRSEAEVLNDIAVHMSEHGDARRALQVFDLAAELDGGTEAKAVAMMNKGNALLNLKEVESAREHFEAAIRLDPKYALAHRRLGDWHSEHGDARRGAGHYAAACEFEPDNALYHANAGTAFLRQGEPARAQKHLARSIELVPDQPHIHYNLAAALVQQGDGAAALRQLAIAVQHDPAYARGWYLKAQIEARMNRILQAADSARSALKYADSLNADEREGARALLRELNMGRS